MKLYAVKQNPNLDKNQVVAGTIIACDVKNSDDFEFKMLSSGSSNLLKLELPVELPIDLLEYNVKIDTSEVPHIMHGFKITGQFTAEVMIWVPDSFKLPVPKQVFIYGVAPIMVRGILLQESKSFSEKKDDTLVEDKKPKKKGRKNKK